MTPQSIITKARQILNDTDAAYYRQSNDELLNYVNDGLKEASLLMPSQFYSTGDYQCVEGQTEQALTHTDAQQFVEVIRIKDGKAVHEMEMKSLSAFNPGWAADAAAPIQNWARNDGDPLRFYIYPKAPVMQLLEILYVRNPATYALTDNITEVPLVWESAFADYVVYRAESKDDEHVDSNRVGGFYATFKMKITGQSPAVQQGA